MNLGIIAGGGAFPKSVARNARAQGHHIIGVGFRSDTDVDFPDLCDSFTWLKLGQLGRLIDFFKAKSVTQAVMAGPINKPRALDLRPDWRAARLLLHLGSRGDDMLLRAVGRELEREGVTVVGPQTFAPDLIAPEGVLSLRAPDDRELADIDFGWELGQRLGPCDIGQSLVIRERIVLAVEAIEGTDAAIRRGGALGGDGAVIVKRPKPDQDRRLDMPAVGLGTIKAMAEVGATCLAIQAGECLFFEQDEALRLANARRMSIIALPPPSPSEAQ